MARAYGPLFSMDARGKLGNSIVFSNWKGQATVRMYAIPYNPKTSSQVAQRTLFTNAIRGWGAVGGSMQGEWNTYAEKVTKPHAPLTGVNCFTRAYIEAGDYPGSPPA